MPRNFRAEVPMTSEELERAKQQAESFGYPSLSSYIRALLFSAEKKIMELEVPNQTKSKEKRK